MAPRPELSIIVPSVNGVSDLRGCLRALESQRCEVDIEVLVVDRLGSAVEKFMAGEFPWATFIAAPSDTAIPDLRALGARAAQAPAVAVINSDYA